MTNNSFPRKHGWSLPPHPAQFVLLLLVILFVIFQFGTILQCLPYSWKPAGCIIPSVLLLYMIICLLSAMTINPAERNVRKKWSVNKKPPPTFDRNENRRHVIENCFCCICEVDVSISAKHCSKCNKCVQGFDHHCIWLNNCIGKRNYTHFIFSVVTAFCISLIGLLSVLVILVMYFFNKESFSKLQTSSPCNSNSKVKYTLAWFEVSEILFLIILAIQGILCLGAAIKLGHLFLFHIYLLKKGMSTYDFIMRKKTEKQSTSIPPSTPNSSRSIKTTKNENDLTSRSDPVSEEPKVEDSQNFSYQTAAHDNAAFRPDSAESLKEIPVEGTYQGSLSIHYNSLTPRIINQQNLKVDDTLQKSAFNYNHHQKITGGERIPDNEERHFSISPVVNGTRDIVVTPRYQENFQDSSSEASSSLLYSSSARLDYQTYSHPMSSIHRELVPPLELDRSISSQLS